MCMRFFKHEQTTFYKRKKKDVDLSRLKAIITAVMNKKQTVLFSQADLSDATISYMPTKGKSSVGYTNGLIDAYLRQKYQVKERLILPKNIKNYHRIIRKDGRIERIESYVHGRIDVVFIAAHEADAFYLFPFSPDGGFYPTYSYVSITNNGITEEVYSITSQQIVLEQYRPINSQETEFVYINAVPDGKVPILEHTYGVILQKQGTLEYNPKSQYSNFKE